MSRYICSKCGREMPRSISGRCVRCLQDEKIAGLELEIEQLRTLLPVSTRAQYFATHQRLPRISDFVDESPVIQQKRCIAVLLRHRKFLINLANDLSQNDPEFAYKALRHTEDGWIWIDLPVSDCAPRAQEGGARG